MQTFEQLLEQARSGPKTIYYRTPLIPDVDYADIEDLLIDVRRLWGEEELVEVEMLIWVGMQVWQLSEDGIWSLV